MPNMLPINEKLRRTRGKLKLTQSELATLLGVSANIVARWERAEVHPGAERMLRLALWAIEHARGLSKK